MERAAQLRAQGHDWQQVADQLNLATSTVSNYPSKYPPFEVDAPNRQGLVGWYRDQLWSEEVQRLVREVQPTALDALLEVLEHNLKGDQQGPSWGHVVQAARAALKATGFEEAQKTRRKLEEQEDVTGEPGERVNVHEADRFDELEDEELDERISTLEDIATDAGEGEDGDS